MATAAVCSLILVSPEAAGAEGEIPITVAYEAPDECGTAEAFFTNVQRRAPHVRAARAGEAAEVVSVVVRRDAVHAAFQGTLSFPAKDPGDERTFRGARCEDVTTALAVALALHAVEAEPKPPHDEAPRSPEREIAVVTPEPHPSNDIDRPARARVEQSLFIGGGVRTGVAPDLAPVAHVAYGLTLSGALPLTLRMGLTYASGTSESLLFRLIAGEVDLCPVRIGSENERWWVAPCGRLELGVHMAEGRDKNEAKVAPPWLAVGPSVRVHLRLVGRIVLEADGGLLLPTSRNRFYAVSDFTRSLEYTGPEAVLAARLSAGFSFR